MRHPSTVGNVPWIYAYDGPANRNTDPSKIGKWMLFTDARDIDTVWACIEEATTRGDLGPASKVATNYSYRLNRVICVYTKDYSDLDDVRRVLDNLRDLGFTDVLYYKEDNATRARLYGNGSSLYTSQTGTEIRQNRKAVT